MPQLTVRRMLILCAFVLVSATIALAQSPTSPEVPAIHARNTYQAGQSPNRSWLAAESAGSSRHKFAVVTFDQPNRRQICRVLSFTVEKLVCSRAFGGSRTYLPRQILALIIPGDEALNIPLWLGFNGGLGAAIWGTVVLAAACPACAVATGVAAFWFFAAAAVVFMGGNQPDRFLYLAPGQQQTGKLRFVQP